MKVFLAGGGLALAAVLASGTVNASVSVSATARQRWPWNHKVDIDVAVPTDQTYDVDLVATWSGNEAGVPLNGGALDGREFCAKGTTHFVWDPVVAGYGDKELVDFAVTARAVTFAERKYLVVDLESGDCTYLAAVPEGGWTDEHKTSKMVFARCPSGTYTIGDETECYTAFGGSRPYSAVRQVTFTSDFYMGIYRVTQMQRYKIKADGATHYGGAWDTASTMEDCHYTFSRGAWDADPSVSVCWPDTGYKVAPDSVLGRLRTLTGNRFVFDLPEEEQWEVAARCGTRTLWPIGGELASDDQGTVTNQTQLTELVNTYLLWSGNPTASGNSWLTGQGGQVGKLLPNPWGLYDMGGLYEFMLDVSNSQSSRPSSATDPTGPLALNDGTDKRAVRGGGRLSGGNSITRVDQLLPSYRGFKWNPSEKNYVATRFAIHLNPLDFNVR